MFNAETGNTGMNTSIQKKQYDIPLIECCFLLFLFMFPLWPEYAVIKPGSLPGINVQRLLVVIVFALWCLILLLSPAYYRRMIEFVQHYAWLTGLLLLMLGWKLCSVSVAAEPLHALFSAVRDTVFSLLLMLMTASIYARPAQLYRAIVVLLLAALVVVLLAVPEVIMEKNIIAQVVPVTSEYTESAISSKIRDDVYRAQATFAHPLSLAQFLVMILPLSLVLIMMHRSWKNVLLGTVTTILCAWGIFVTGSRSPLAIMAFLLAAFLIMRLLSSSFRDRMDYLRAASSLLLLLIAVVIGGDWLLSLIAGSSESEAMSSYYRLRQLELGIPLIGQHPLLGYGPGQAAATIGMVAQTVDNYFLTLALESGMPELLAFVLLILLLLIHLWTAAMHSHDRSARLLLMALFYSTLGYFSFLTIISLKQVMPLVFIMCGMGLSVKLQEDQQGHR